MVISTQHLVPQEPTKPKASTAAPDPNSQPAPSPASGNTIKAEEEASAGDVEVGGEEELTSVPMQVDGPSKDSWEVPKLDDDKVKPEDESKNKTPAPTNQSTTQQQTQQQPQPSQQQRKGQGSGPALQQTSKEKEAAPQIDLFLEASKLPLDVAIFNSTRAAGGDDKIRKYLQAVLVVGGTALTPGMAHALESRFVRLLYYLICTSLVVNPYKRAEVMQG